MIADNLAKLSRDELVVLALKQGLPKPHHKLKPETIIKNIMDSVNYPAKPIVEALPEPKKKEVVFLSEEEIEELVAPIKARAPQFEVLYDEESRSVTFRCRGAEDCMSMSTPSRLMFRLASTVSRGRVALLGRPEFEKGNATGPSSYTNVVLA